MKHKRARSQEPAVLQAQIDKLQEILDDTINDLRLMGRQLAETNLRTMYILRYFKFKRPASLVDPSGNPLGGPPVVPLYDIYMAEHDAFLEKMLEEGEQHEAAEALRQEKQRQEQERQFLEGQQQYKADKNKPN